MVEQVTRVPLAVASTLTSLALTVATPVTVGAFGGTIVALLTVTALALVVAHGIVALRTLVTLVAAVVELSTLALVVVLATEGL